MLLVLSCIVLFFSFYVYFVRPLGYWKKKGVKGGNPVWIFGDIWESIILAKPFNDIVVRLYRKHANDRYFGMYMYNEPILVVRDPEIIKNITVRDFRYFTDHRVIIPDYSDPIWGRNLFELKGQRWRNVRSILSPAFTISKLASLVDIFDEYAQRFVKYIDDKNQDIIEVDVKEEYTKYGNDVISNTAFGIDIDSLNEPDNEFFTHGKFTHFNGLGTFLKMSGFFLFPRLLQLLGIKLFDKETQDFYHKFISDMVKEREDQNLVRRDFLAAMMNGRYIQNIRPELNLFLDGSNHLGLDDWKVDDDTKKTIDIQDMVSYSMAFIFSAYDSIPNLLSFISYELALSPLVQDKLREEINQFWEKCDGKLTYDVLQNMKYLEAVVLEGARKWPIDFNLDRKCTRPYTIQPVKPGEKPLHIELGTSIWLPAYAIQRDPKIYPNPENFEPERFMPENKAKLNQYAFLTFGVGPRNCIGMRYAIVQCKAMLFHLIKQYEMIPAAKSESLNFKRSTFQYEVKDGFLIGLRHLKV